MIFSGAASFRYPVENVCIEGDGTLIEEEEALVVVSDTTLMVLGKDHMWSKADPSKGLPDLRESLTNENIKNQMLSDNPQRYKHIFNTSGVNNWIVQLHYLWVLLSHFQTRMLILEEIHGMVRWIGCSAFICSSKMFCTIYNIFFVFKTLRVCNSAKREEKVWNNTEILYGYRETI